MTIIYALVCNNDLNYAHFYSTKNLAIEKLSEISNNTKELNPPGIKVVIDELDEFSYFFRWLDIEDNNGDNLGKNTWKIKEIALE